MEISVTGAKIYCTIPGINYPVTQTVVNTWLIMAVVVALCIWMTRGMQVHARTKRQIVAEYLVNMVTNLVDNSMGVEWRKFVPLIAAIFTTSVLGSFIGLTGMYCPTNDLNTFLAWSIVVFVLITYYKIKANGLGGYLKGYLDPIFILAPINVISEIATPVSMTFRHFGNCMSGYVIGLLVYGALGSVSQSLLGWLPAQLGTIPWLQIGVPAILNVYFTIFSGCVQAFIFCMLTMMFISQAADAGDE